ncbi:Zn-ribbon domain-containing OB-fold protein [Streptomyces viridiviolaceus]
MTTPVPVIDADSAPFWDGCARGELLGQRCGACGAWRWPPREHCPACHTTDPRWQALPGTGRITGLTVLHRPFDPRLAEEIPLAVVHVVLDGTDDEMVLTSRLVRGEATDAAVGDRVRVRFTPVPDGPALPTFTRITQGDQP